MNFYKFCKLSQPQNLVHAVSNRCGGQSNPPFDSLNISFGVGDYPTDVEINRQMIKESLNLGYLISARQTHSDRILVVDSSPESDQEVEGYDALITKQINVGLMIQQADCQAIMLYDPVRKVIANIHVGWKGTTLNIIGKTIAQMTEQFSSSPANIAAAISPSLGPCCAEFINFTKELPPELHKYQVTNNHFDFWAISRDQLAAAGVSRENIEIAKICTKCEQNYFSYRREKITGRFASVLALLPPEKH